MPQDNFKWLILFRVSMFFIGFAAYFIERKRREAGFSEYSSNLFLKYQKEPGDRTAEKKATLCMRISENVYLQMLPKKRWVGWLTKISLGIYPKLGVQKLDDLFQIATDNQMILKKLRDDHALQSALVKTHSLGFETIKSNGNGTLIFDCKSSRTGGLGPDVFLPELAKIKECFDASSQSTDRSGNWLNVIRALWYGVAFYGLAAVASYFIDNGTTHLGTYDHMLKGGVTGFLLIAGWVSAVFILLRESSWIPIVLNELLVPFSMFALISGSHLFGDLNRVLDRSPKVANVAVVERKYSESSTTARNKSSVNYFLELKFEENPYEIPEKLLVSLLVYSKFNPGDGAKIKIRNGFFGSPYIAEIIRAPYPKKLKRSTEDKPPTVASNLILSLSRWKADYNASPKGPSGKLRWHEVKYASGKLRQREPIIDGKIHGEATYWFENGVKYATINWVNGEKHGRIKLYTDQGQLEQSLSYRFGKLHGLCSWYDGKGEVTHRAVYEDDRVISTDRDILDALAKEIGEF